jgi:DNA-binding MarR family transcriptional regulator
VQRETASAAVRAWLEVQRVQRGTAAALREALAGDLTLPRMELLDQLGQQDGRSLAALARAMQLTAANLTGLVDRAEREGLVERRDDPSDRRAARVHLTRRGRRLHAEALARQTRRIEEVFAVLAPRELESLATLLARLDGALAARAPRRARGRRAEQPGKIRRKEAPRKEDA